jgi:hypothetical protein
MTARRTTDEASSLVPAPPGVPDPALREWAEELVVRARAEGVELTGDDGLLTGLVHHVLQTSLEVVLADHLGYEPYDAAGRGSGNSRMPRRVGRSRPRSARSSWRSRATVAACSSP